MELFYYQGTPTNVIFDGNHMRWKKTKFGKDKYGYTAQFDSILLVHSATHLIAQFNDNSNKVIMWSCQQRKDNHKLHGAGTALVLDVLSCRA